MYYEENSVVFKENYNKEWTVKSWDLKYEKALFVCFTNTGVTIMKFTTIIKLAKNI